MSSPLYNIAKNVGFTRYGKVINLPSTKAISECRLDDIFNFLNNKTGSNFIQSINNETRYLKANSLLDTLKYPFVDLPKDFLAFISKKFNIKSLQDSNLLQNYVKAQQDKSYQRAMRGLIKNGDNFIAQFAKEKGINTSELEKFLCKNECNPQFKELCDSVVKKFYKLFDENLAKDKAHYHTPHERTIVRLVSGLTAAIMLGNDFYNKSIMNGVSEDEAIKSASTKRKQEILATVQEALSQYFLLGAFASFSNNSQLGAPLLNTALGILFHITSRLSTKRPLKRIDLPEKPQNQSQLAINKFIDNIKKGNEPTLNNDNQEKEENKKHLLSLKNILLATLASIGIGFAFKGIKSTKTFNNLKDTILNLDIVKELSKKYHNFTVGEVWVDKNEADEFCNLFGSIGSKNAKIYYTELFNNAFKTSNNSQTQKILLGEYEKMSKIPFTNIQMSRKELLQIPLMPIKFVTELLSYPYKAVHKILEGLKVVKKPEKIELKNDYHILNTYLDFKEQLAKFGGTINDDFLEFYKNHIQKNRISALNKETQSSVKNAAIGKTTQLMGTFGSLYFAMTDEFNNTASQTGDKQKAQKDARLRGINKIIRIATQIVIMNINNIFKIPYAQSILGAGVITAICTMLTDSISRTLSGMPYRKMDKEELEKYYKEHKEGKLKGYYDMLDKLTE